MVIGTLVEVLAAARTTTTGLALSVGATVIVLIKTRAEHLDVSISPVNPRPPGCLALECMEAVSRLRRSAGASTFLTNNSQP